MKKKKYMILCVAGQSNAVGYDESVISQDYLEQFHTERIRQLGLYGEDNLKLIPLGACAQSYQDLRPFSNPANSEPNLGTKGIQLPLADLLLPYIPEDYDIVVLSCAYGGTGFTVGDPGVYNTGEKRPEPGILSWGAESPYYYGMKDRIRYLLNLAEENQFLGVVWIQGEHDHADAKGQKAGFEKMTEDFFRTMHREYPHRVYRGDWNRDIWFNVETVSYWYTVGECPQIWDNYRGCNEKTYVDIPRTVDSNEVNGTGATAAIRGAHFGNDAFVREVAPRTLKKMVESWGQQSIRK